MGERAFRTSESYRAEEITRNMVRAFLDDRGFMVKSDKPEHQGQTVVALSPKGDELVIRVRLCWRRESGTRKSERVHTYSAAQLLAKIKNSDWIGSLEDKVRREKSRGVTHMLFLQRENEDIKYAALVPLFALVPIWIAQRDISDRLIRTGRLGRRKKNHAMNGHSPTLWLQDDRGGKEVADAFWGHPDVINLNNLLRLGQPSFIPEEVSESSSYSEGSCRRILVNAYERDENARRKCLEYYGPSCTICGFDFGDVYGEEARGYIHVHHLRPLSEVGGEYVVDPVKDLRPVCPNCHAVLHLGGQCRLMDEVRRLLGQKNAQHCAQIDGR